MVQVGPADELPFAEGPVAGFEAGTVINRKDFGIDIEMPLETGGTVVGDKITINLEIEAGNPAAA